MYRLYERCCCGCCNLKQGSLILAWIGVIASVLNLLSSIKEFGGLSAAKYELQNDDDFEEQLDCDDDCINLIFTLITTVMVFGVISNLVVLVVASLVIHGINNNKEKLLTPYYVYSLVSLTLGCILCLVAIIACFMFSVAMGFVMGFVLGGAMLLSFYFMVVVRSYQLQMREESGACAMRLEHQQVVTGAPVAEQKYLPTAAPQQYPQQYPQLPQEAAQYPPMPQQGYPQAPPAGYPQAPPAGYPQAAAPMYPPPYSEKQ